MVLSIGGIINAMLLSVVVILGIRSKLLDFKR